jgi:hypothetical protein
MWTCYEAVHAVTYFTPESREALEAAGLRGFWRGYFAGRAAPLGPVAAAPVTALFFNFAPSMVGRALPDVWSRAAPQEVLRARRAGATAALRRLVGGVDVAVEEAAALAELAVAHADTAGRALAAANAALAVAHADTAAALPAGALPAADAALPANAAVPSAAANAAVPSAAANAAVPSAAALAAADTAVPSAAVLAAANAAVPSAAALAAADTAVPSAAALAAANAAVPSAAALAAANGAVPAGEAEPLARLWQAATTLREHRGDGHVAALVAAGFTGCQALVLRSALDGNSEMYQQARGWTGEQWAAARDELIGRGWLDGGGQPTATGRDAYREVEDTTDRIAAGPWRELGSERTERLAGLLQPMVYAVSAALPFPNPVGLPRPRDARPR